MLQLGAIVRFRNRDWILLPSDREEELLLRPLTGTADDVVAVHRLLSDLLRGVLPTEGISESRFPWPQESSVADAQSLHLFWQAARLLLREGAAPLRCLGRISVRPRTYQLVPLLMALQMEPVRLLIADDVGVGKTIEAGLIARELWDRREIRRLAVLCPPYLCDQWQKELREKFHLEAVVIGPATIGRLERRLPPDRSVYSHYPVQVISIDFVKFERNKHRFLLEAPEFIIVDEAHGATPSHRGQSHRHLRYELVKELASEADRHLILLTATPHSGIPEAFQKLLGLLRPEFEGWNFTDLDDSQSERLARHFVQRTRKEISERWAEGPCFPTRETLDRTYLLSPKYHEFFHEVYAFCEGIVKSGIALKEAHKRRMRWWSALALLRCVMSSPRAAQVALRKRRLARMEGEQEDWFDETELLEGFYPPNERSPSDELPTPLLDKAEEEAFSESEKRRLRELEHMAQELSEAEDTKLAACLDIVRSLLREGFNPVVWCFYVETAEYLAEKLSAALSPGRPSARVLCITGRLSEEERRLKVEEFMQEEGPRVLVATDCLSEGINLQDGFNAVIHYDLPWNPNRMEQREGRVDRYGQRHPVVRAVRFYGRDNPVDGAVIRVLLDKAREIRQTLGTYVPIPEDERGVIEALIHALFFGQESRAKQLMLQFQESQEDPVPLLHQKWEEDREREERNRRLFAQFALRPEEVARELEAVDRVLGDPDAVREFVLAACQRLGVPVRAVDREKDVWRITTERSVLQGLPKAIARALPSRRNHWTITFTSPTPEGAEYLGRNHPFVVTLAHYLFEEAFASSGCTATARCGAIRTNAVDRLTTLLLLRPRYLLRQDGRPPLLAEEVLVVGWEAGSSRFLSSERALRLLASEPTANISEQEKRHLVASALQEARALLSEEPSEDGLLRVLDARAGALREAHQRLRRSVGQRKSGFEVELRWPPDLLGVLVLQPEVRL